MDSSPIDALRFDLVHVYRRLKGSPRFVAAVLFSLGLGNGLTIAAFSAVNSVVLRPFPYREPDQLGVLWGSTSWSERPSVDKGEVTEWISQCRVVQDHSFFQMNPISFTLEGGDVVNGGMLGATTFSLLGRTPSLGRAFIEGSESGGAEASVILSDGFWTSHFGRDPGVLGRSLRLNGRPHTVVGVMPAGFFFPDQYFRLWVPLGDQVSSHALVRLRQGKTVDEAQDDLSRWIRSRPSAGAGTKALGVYRLHSAVVTKYSLALGTLLAASVLLLLIASANVANLLLVRGAAKVQDAAICAALGATGSRVLRVLLLEGLVLGIGGGSLGLLSGWSALRAVTRLGLTDVSRLEDSTLDGNVLVFALCVSVLSGAIAGLGPAWMAVRADLVSVLQAPSGHPNRFVRGRLQGLLVTLETALALMLLIIAGLFTSSFVRLARADWGFDPAGLLAVEVTLPDGGGETARWVDVIERVSARLSRLPMVAETAVSFGIPIKYTFRRAPLRVLGQMTDRAECWTVGSGYFRAMKIPLLRGREFGPSDGTGRQRVTVVSRDLAHSLWPGQDPIGKDLELLTPRQAVRQRMFAGPPGSVDLATANSPDSWEPDGAPLRVIGEVGVVRAFALDVAPKPALYLEYRQDPVPLPKRGFFVARSAADPQQTSIMIRKEVSAVVGADSVRSVTEMSGLVGTSIGSRGPNGLLLIAANVLGGLGWLFATVGIYGLVSLTVTQRAREIAVRVALGAQSSQIIAGVLKEGIRPVLFGVGLGLSGAFMITRQLKALLFEVTPMDPLIVGAASIALLFSACAGCLLPAVGLLATSPAATLRQQ